MSNHGRNAQSIKLPDLLKKYFDNNFIFDSDFTFTPEFITESEEFLIYLKKTNDNRAIISLIDWIKYLILRYNDSPKMHQTLTRLLVTKAFNQEILLKCSDLNVLSNEIIAIVQNNQDLNHVDFSSQLLRKISSADILVNKNLSPDFLIERDEFHKENFTKKSSPKPYITIEFPSVFPKNTGSYGDFQRYFHNRYLQLSQLIKEELKPDERALVFENISNIEDHQVYIFILFIEQVNIVQASRSNKKSLDQEIQFHGVIPLSITQFVISLNFEKLHNIDPLSIPSGIVCGFKGEIEKISKFNHTNVIYISGSELILPFKGDSFQPKPSTKQTKSSQNVIDNYALTIGSLNIDKISKQEYQKLINWLANPPINYRIKYVFFIGGIISSLPISRINENKQRISDYYNHLFSDISSLPESIDYFFVPGINDFTRRYLPQPPLTPIYQKHKKNMHFLSNPAKLTLEDQKIIFLNPFPSFWLKECPYKDNSYKLLFDLLQFRHLLPNWNQTLKSVPDEKDYLVIDRIPNIIISTHVSDTNVPIYKNILTGTIAPFIEQDESKLMRNQGKAILFNIKNPTKREIINLLK